MPAVEGENETGFWESVDVYRLNNEILASAGSSWDDWRRFNPDWFRSVAKNAFKARACEILERDFSDSSLFVLKDPRLCRLLPFWLEVIGEFDAEPACVLPLRNPLEIAASLKKRNSFSPPKSHMLWLRHVLDAENGTRGLKRAFVNYEGMLNDWRGELADLSHFLNIAWPRRSATAEVEIDRFLEYRHRHFARTDGGLFDNRGVGQWVKDAYSALLDMHNDPRSERLQSSLDTVRTEINRASDAFGAILRIEEMERKELADNTSARIGELEREASMRMPRIAELEKVVAEREGQHDELRQELLSRASQIADLKEAAAQREKRHDELRQEVLSRESRIAELEGAAAQREGRLDEFRQEVLSRESRIVEMERAAALREGQLDDFRQEVLSRESRIAELEGAASQREEQLDELRQEKSSSDSLIVELEVAAAQHKARITELERNRRHEEVRIGDLQSELVSKAQQNSEILVLRNQILHRLNALQSSAAWEFARPMRAAESRWPKFMRGVVVLPKIAWWGLTLRLPERLSLHRQAKELLVQRLFDSSWYVEQNPDTVLHGIDPIMHWLLAGWKEGRDPNPLFDTDWYLAQNPDVVEAGYNPLAHYVASGANEGRDPSPLFDTEWYLAQNPDVAAAGINPLSHYLTSGAAEGRSPTASEQLIIEHARVPVASPTIDLSSTEIHDPSADSTPQSAAVSSTDAPAEANSAKSASSATHSEFLKTLRASQEEGPYYQEEDPKHDLNPQVKLIAFYLPQFHPIPENDANWGKGFTEWINTTRAVPRYSGHYQPRIPGEMGYYDLRDPDIQRRQIELAKAHGIGGFCYHHYWFGGKKVLRRPIETHLSDPSMDFPFCINWANEPWTARWDGHRESGVLIDQIHSPEDDIAFIRDIEHFLRDERYIRVEGKPLLSVYRPTLFPNMKETIDRWQSYCLDRGIGELFIVMVQSFEINDPRIFGFNGAIEFPPHNMVRQSYKPVSFFSDARPPDVWSYRAMAHGSMHSPAEEFTWFRGITMGWDNSARKTNGWVFHGCNPHIYGEWLRNQCLYAIERLPSERRLVFINAWNEWAEGTYLEPDRHFGYAFLNHTGEILKEFDIKAELTDLAVQPGATPAKMLHEYLATRHGDDIKEWIRSHFVLFGLPVTAEEVKLPTPARGDIDRWIEHLVARSVNRDDRNSTDKPDVSILVPVHNEVRFTLSCLVSLLSHASKYSFEVIVGDDQSTDSTTLLQEHVIPGLRYIRHEKNIGFLKNCNEIARHARGRYLVLLNNDTVTLPDWLDALIDTLDDDPNIGLVGSKLVYPDGRLQEAGSIIWDDAGGWNWGNLKDPQDPEYNYRRDVDYCSGASIAIPTALWCDLGGFDGERYQQAYYEDTDLAFRVREDKGLRVIYQPLSHLLHFEGVSSGRSLETGIKQFQQTNRPLFAERWKHIICHHGNPLALPDNFVERTPGKRLLLIDVVTPLPDQDSGSVDTFNYLKIFCQMGFKVTLLPENTSYKGHYVRDLQKLGVRVLHAPYVSSFTGTLCKEAPTADVILIYRETAHRHMSLLRSVAPGVPVIFNTVDLHFLRKEREAMLLGTKEAKKEAAQTKDMEMAAMKQADATIVLSCHEEELLSKLAPKVKLARIPIVREIPGRTNAGFLDREDVVFIGGFLHTPNVDAVRYFTKEVWPLVKEQDLGRPCRFIIAGSNIPSVIQQLASSDVVIRGHVPDLSDLYTSALLSVSPLRYGAGLKGKVISSLCYGVPVVGTSISIEGSGLCNEHHLLAADTPESMAVAIARLHNDAALWSRLSDNGMAYCIEQFSFSSVGQRLRALLSDLNIV